MNSSLITAPQWVGIIIGFIIGGFAEAWGIANPESIIRLTRWIDRLFIVCISIGAGFAVILLYSLYAAGIDMHFGLKPLYFYGVGFGAILFGIGLAVSGYFPGSEWMALGEGRRDAVFAIPAGLLGAATWTVLYQTRVGQWLVSQADAGSILITGRTINAMSPLSIVFVAIPYAIVLFLIAYFLPRFRGSRHSCIVSMIKGGHDENNPVLHALREDTVAFLLEGSIAKNGGKAEKFAFALSSQPNVYSPVLIIVGIIVGFIVVLDILLHQIFGESTTYSWIIAILILPTYRYSVGILSHVGWEPFSDIGTFMGAFFSSVVVTKRFTAFRKIVPPSWRNRFGNDEWKRAFGVFVGSYLMLFGARMADGCASGHILSGIVQMSASGLYFGVIVMIFAVITAKLLYGSVSEKTML